MKRFTKLIGAVTCAAMLFSTVAYGTNIAPSVNASDEVQLVISFAAGNNGKPVTVQIFEPGKNPESLKNGSVYNATDNALLNQAISFADEYIIADNKITVSYVPKGKKGEYKVYTKIAGAAKEELSFTFKRDNGSEPDEIITNLVAAPTAGNVQAVFAADVDEVITDYEFLEIDTNAETKDFYEKVNATLTDAQKDVMYGSIASKVAAEGTTPEAFRSLYKKMAYIALVDNLTGDSLLDFIDTNKAYSAVETNPAYTTIRENSAYFTDAVKGKLLEALAARNMSTYTEISQVNTAFAEEILSALLSYCEAPGTVVDMVSAFSTEITNAGGDSSKLAGTNALDMADTLMNSRPFANFAAFITALNSLDTQTGGVVQDPAPVVPDTSSGPSTSISMPSGGTGGVVTNSGTQGSAPGTTPADTVFTDLKGYEWAESAIATLRNRGIINGKTATEYAPADTVLREEFAKMIMLTVLPKTVGTYGADSGFGDVDRTAWHAPFITAAAKNNIISGYGVLFGIGDTIRREDMTVMCYRAVKAAGFTLIAEREEHQFTDEISDYAKEAVSVMYKAGLINGNSETEFNGNGTATRAEAAMILHNIIQKYGK